MRSIVRYILPAIVGCLITVSCSKTPKGVLDEDDMVALLVDIHKGEGLVEMQRTRFYSDSLRKALKQSIYLQHGVTAEQVDTSFVWYGNHIEEYIKVYDRVIQQLEDEMKSVERSAANETVYAVGDSIDVWSSSSFFRLDPSLPAKNISFLYQNDENWEPGDNYTLQFKVFNQRPGKSRVETSLFVKYEDGDVEYRKGTAAEDGWTRLRLVTDSTRMASSLFGGIIFNTDRDEVIYIDSLSLVRTRSIPSTYHQRFSQKKIRKPKTLEDEAKDSI